MYSLDCFKAYDIRGVVPEQLNPELAYEIGRAFADTIGGSLEYFAFNNGKKLSRAINASLSAFHNS